MRSPGHPCPNYNNVRVPGAYGYQSIHTQTIPFVFKEHTVTRASMPRPQQHSCSKSIRSPGHPCPNHDNVRFPGAFGHQSIYAQTNQRSCSRSIRSPNASSRRNLESLRSPAMPAASITGTQILDVTWRYLKHYIPKTLCAKANDRSLNTKLMVDARAGGSACQRVQNRLLVKCSASGNWRARLARITRDLGSAFLLHFVRWCSRVPQ